MKVVFYAKDILMNFKVLMKYRKLGESNNTKWKGVQHCFPPHLMLCVYTQEKIVVDRQVKL